MSDIHVQVSKLIEATPERVYNTIADYQKGHRAILPKRYFTDMTVLEGSQGAGTVIKVKMNVMGARRHFRLQVSEPEPGRVLVESDPESGTITTFTIDAVDQGQSSRVTIETIAKANSGLRGFMEKLFNPAITRRIYQEELELLADYVQGIASY